MSSVEHRRNTLAGYRRELLDAGWPTFSIGGWSFYFLVKFALAALGELELLFWENLAMLAFLLLPLHSPLLRVLRHLLVALAAVVVLYKESYLPPFERLIAQWDFVSSFNFSYQVELVLRFIDVRMVAALLVFLIVYKYMARILNLTSVSLLALLTSPWWAPQMEPLQFGEQSLPLAHEGLNERVNDQPAERLGTERNTTAEPSNPAEALEQFYQQQGQFQIETVLNEHDEVDVLLLNICSMSWQDLEISGFIDHPVITGADITLTNFYSGSSYSGPATLRLMRAGCGHEPHNALFDENVRCTLGDIFTPNHWQHELVFNHHGDFDDYLNMVRQYGGFDEARFMPLDDAPQSQLGFDQMPVYSDNFLLNQWFEGRTSQPSSITLYNSVSLHDGNQLFGFRGNSMASYQARAEALLEDIQQLYDRLENSERPTIVVLAPEHGAGLQGDRFQVPGMREIPSPALTHVPVTFKLFGFEREGSAVQVDDITGPSAIAQILVNTLQQAEGLNLRDVTQGLPRYKQVAENDGAVMIEFNSKVYIQTSAGRWVEYRR